MKKKGLSTSIIFASILVSSCTPSTEDKFNVYFFTANVNATKVETLFEQVPGELIEAPENPERQGFVFSGWYLDINYSVPWDFEKDLMLSESFVLYAKWDFLIGNISYELNGGTIVDENYPTTYTPGQTIVLPQARKTGFIFRGWYTYPQDYIAYPNSFGTKPGEVGIINISSSDFGDFVFYAHFHPVQVFISFIPNYPNATVVLPLPAQQKISYGSIVEYGVNFPNDYGVINGYIFVGWNSRRNGSGTWFRNGDIITRLNDFDLFGQWEAVN
jgi:uncharacterized repeat protein (TIGR02543 family)